MPSADRRGRLALSCDACRSRKSRCIRLQSGLCQRCTAMGCQCITSHEKGSRPYYQTSKEQFELMSTIVRSFLPHVSMETEDLRKVVSSLRGQGHDDSAAGSCSPPRSEEREQQPQHNPQSMQAAAAEPPSSQTNPTALGGAPLTEHTRNSNNQPAAQDPFTVNSFHIAANSTNTRGSPNRNHPVQTGQLLSPLLTTPPHAEPVSGQESLVPDARDVHRFDSGSGWGSFFQTIQSRLASSNSHLVQPWPRDCADGRPVALVAPGSLPLRSVADRATERFFAEVNSVIWILSYEKFMDTVENIYSPNQPTSNASVASLLAIVALAEGSEEVLQSACQYFDLAVSEGSLESVQMIMILALCRLNRGERNVGWVLLGSAVRICLSLGFHRDLGNWSHDRPHTVEMKKRLWWSLCDLDLDLTSSIGRPSEYRTADPQEVINILTTELCTNPYVPPGYSAASASLSTILGRIFAKLYSNLTPRRRCESTPREMLAELNGWWTCLPAHLLPSCPTPSMHFRATSYLHLRYHQYVMLLTRPYLLKSEADEPCEFTAACEESNRQSIQILKELGNRNLLSQMNYLDGSYILSTGMILFLRALKRPSRELLDEVESYRPTLRVAQHLRVGRAASEGMASFAQYLSALLQESRNLMNPEEPADNGTGKEITFQQMDLDQIFEGYWDSTISGGFDWSIIPD